MNFVIAGLCLAYASLAGFGLLKMVLKDGKIFSSWGIFPLSLTAGLGLLGVVGNLYMLLRIPLSFWSLAIALLPFVLFGLALLKIKVHFKNPHFTWQEILLIAVILFGTLSVFLMSVDFPLHFWDSRAIWGIKAKMLFSDGTIFSPNFMDPQRIQPHFRYPLFFPLSQAFIYFSLGQMDDWAVMLLIGLIFPALVMLMFDLIRILTGNHTRALIGAAMLAVMPVFYLIDGPAFSGYADTPLALFFLASFTALILWKKTKEDKLFLFGCLLSGTLPLVKNEGTMLLFINFVLIAWPEDIKAWKAALKNSAFFLLSVGIILLPWLVLRHYIPNAQDEQYAERLSAAMITSGIMRVPTIITFFAKAYFGFQADMLGHYFVWVGLWYIFILAALRSFLRKNWLGIKIAVALFVFLAVMTLIYTIAPVKDTMDLVNLMVASFFRVSLAITPLAILAICLEIE